MARDHAPRPRLVDTPSSTTRRRPSSGSSMPRFADRLAEAGIGAHHVLRDEELLAGDGRLDALVELGHLAGVSVQVDLDPRPRPRSQSTRVTMARRGTARRRRATRGRRPSRARGPRRTRTGRAAERPGAVRASATAARHLVGVQRIERVTVTHRRAPRSWARRGSSARVTYRRAAAPTPPTALQFRDRIALRPVDAQVGDRATHVPDEHHAARAHRPLLAARIEGRPQRGHQPAPRCASGSRANASRHRRAAHRSTRAGCRPRRSRARRASACVPSVPAPE